MTSPATANLTDAEIREMIRTLADEALGPTLAAFVCAHPRPDDLRAWVDAEQPRPTGDTLSRLHTAYRCWTIVAEPVGPDIARQWFIGTNPRLGTAPVEAIRDSQHDRVLAAAHAFAADDHY